MRVRFHSLAITLLSLAFWTLLEAGCATAPRPQRSPQSADPDAMIREEKNRFYQNSIPSRFHEHIEISPSLIAEMKNAACAAEAYNHSDIREFIRTKLNRPFWFAPIYKSGVEYVLGSRADLMEFNCLIKSINAGTMLEKQPLAPDIAQILVEQPEINWAIFNLFNTDFESNDHDAVILKKIIRHPKVDVFSVDEINRTLFLRPRPASFRIAILSELYDSKVYVENRKFFDKRLGQMVLTMAGDDLKPLIEFLVARNPEAFDPEVLLHRALAGKNENSDFHLLLDSLAKNQPFEVRAGFFLDVIQSQAKLANADKRFKVLFSEAESGAGAADGLIRFVTNYDFASSKLSIDTIYDTYSSLLSRSPVSAPTLRSVIDLARDQARVDKPRRIKLFMQACPLAAADSDTARTFLATTQFMNQEDPAIFPSLIDCLTSLALRYSADTETLRVYKSLLHFCQDVPLRMRYSRELLEKKLGDLQFIRNVTSDAFGAQSADGYAILEIILQDSRLEVFDLDQISLIVFRHAGKANANDRRLITLMNASPLATKEIKDRNEQTLTGKWRQLEIAPPVGAGSAKD